MKTKYKHYAVLTASTLGLTGLSLASGFGDEKYIYDASGNMVEKHIGELVTSYDYSGNQLTGSDGDSGMKQYQYDASGRLIGEKKQGIPTRKMEYQYLDKVTEVQNGDKTTELFYNAEGQLVGTNTTGNAETFAWDGLAMVKRGEQIYINEEHGVGGVPAIVGNEVAVTDMIGSSLSVGDGPLESTAFGEGLTTGLFTGKPFIEDLDGFLFNFRIYSANTARWASSDPSGFPDGTNNVTYVGGDPLSEIDPLGLRKKVPMYSMSVGSLTQLNFSYGYTATYNKGTYDGIASGSVEEQGGPIAVGPGSSCNYGYNNAVNSSWTTSAGISATLWDGVTAQVGSTSGGGSSNGTSTGLTWTHPGNGDLKQYDVIAAKRKIIHAVTRTITHRNTGTTFNPVWTLSSPPGGPYNAPSLTSYFGTGINVYEL